MSHSHTEQTLSDTYCKNRNIGSYKYLHSDGFDTYTFSKSVGYGVKILELRTEQLLKDSDEVLTAIYN